MSAAILYDAVHYWLVDHPIISQYEWQPGVTPGASPFFVSTAAVTYLSLTFLFHRCPILPTLPSAALRLAAAAHNVTLCLLSLVMAAGCTLSVIHQTPPENLTWCVCFPAGATAARRSSGPTCSTSPRYWIGVRRHAADPPRRVPIVAAAVVPPRVPPRGGAGDVLYMWLAEAQTLFPVGLVTNASVHVLMYAYYLLAALGFRPWWKRMVTDCQITQFLFGYLISGLMLYLHFTGSGCSGLWFWGLNTLFTTSLLALFINFHLNNYSNKKMLGDKRS